MSQWHLETISPQHLELLKKTARFTDFILVGGTALALQIGHRKSYDLDFVTTKEISSSVIDSLLAVIQPKNLQQRLLSNTQYTAFVDGIKITLFQDKAPLLHQKVMFDESGLAAIADIFATKLFVLGKRNFWRDYVDIACSLDRGAVTLRQGLKEAISRYKVTEKWILEPLAYFEDVDIVPIEWIGKELNENDVKNILIKEVENLVKEESV